MKLDRNLNADGTGKHELRNLRTGQIVEDCGPGEEHEFFVLMLKDQYASRALIGYAEAMGFSDPELEKLICIVMRNYVTMIRKAESARQALATALGAEGGK